MNREWPHHVLLLKKFLFLSCAHEMPTRRYAEIPLPQVANVSESLYAWVGSTPPYALTRFYFFAGIRSVPSDAVDIGIAACKVAFHWPKYLHQKCGQPQQTMFFVHLSTVEEEGLAPVAGGKAA